MVRAPIKNTGNYKFDGRAREPLKNSCWMQQLKITQEMDEIVKRLYRSQVILAIMVKHYDREIL
jgi:hypothetical protein